MRAQNKHFNSVQDLSDIGTSLSDFEEIPNQYKNYTILSISYSCYVEKMKSKINNKYYAIKKIIKNSKNFKMKDFEREIQIHSQLNHENIISFYGYFEDKEEENKMNEILEDATIYCLVLEFVENGSLENYLFKHREKYKEYDYIPIEQDFIIKILTQALSALNYLQSQSILHRDLYLDNILLDRNNNIKIVDFGLSALMKDDNPINKNKDSILFCNYSIVGRVDVASPEIQKRKKYDYKTDIFSLGLSMICLMSQNKNNLINLNKNGIKNMDKSYCKDLINLVKEMIIENPEKRINCQKAYFKILQINNSTIIHSPNFNPIKYLDHIGIQLSDFEEIKHGQKNYFILGAGNFGYTEKMKSKKDNKIYAIKKLPTEMDLKAKKYFRRETEIMINLINENIVKFYGYFRDREKKINIRKYMKKLIKKEIKKLI